MTQPKITKEMILTRIDWALANETSFDTPLMQQIKSYLSQDEWLPIESAPRDGTEILITFDNKVYLVEWGQGCLGNEGWFSNERYVNLSITATHWQPLPTPPTNEDK